MRLSWAKWVSTSFTYFSSTGACCCLQQQVDQDPVPSLNYECPSLERAAILIWVFCSSNHPENKHGLYMVFSCNRQKLIHPLFESFGILLPGQGMQEYPHGIKTNVGRPAKFFVYHSRIECFCLPFPVG